MPKPLPGTYVLILHLAQGQTIRIGKLGSMDFKRGYYGYVGSAFGPGGLAARIHHHLKKRKNPHWHVDYLRRRTSPVQIWWSATRNRREHDWATVMAELPVVYRILKGFGSSDCGCLSHLFYFKRPPEFNVFQNALTQAGFENTVNPVLNPEIEEFNVIRV